MERWIKGKRSLKESNDMVSEIVGTVVLLAVVVICSSTMYAIVLSNPSPQDPNCVNLVGTVEGNNIVIEHRGGDPLGLDTNVFITIGNETKKITIGDENYLDEAAKLDKQWNVGERVVFPFDYDINISEADVSVSDKESSSLVLLGTIDITPECDIGLIQTVDDQTPYVGDTVNLTIKATHYRGDMDDTKVRIIIFRH